LYEGDWLAATEAWACGLAVRQVVTLEAPVGRWRERLDQLDARLAKHGIALVRARRTWDSRLWPGATCGFFPFRKHAYRQAHLDCPPGAADPEIPNPKVVQSAADHPSG
jgi:deoxyribodipyrimidine photo-lyase